MPLTSSPPLRPLNGLVCLALVLPWLNPFAPGPWSAVVPWLVSLACCAVWIVLRPATSLVTAELAGRSWLLAACLSSAIGLIQYFGWASEFAPWVNGKAMGEAFANLRQRNQFATLTSMGVAVMVWMYAKQQGARPWHVFATGLIAVGAACSTSRTGALQLVLLTLLAWIWGDWRNPAVRRVLIVGLLVYSLASVALPWVVGDGFLTQGGMLGRLRTGEPLCASRLTLWANVLHLIAMKPWLGWGWGELDFAHFETLYPGPRFCDILDNAHNLPLQLAVELGVPVAVLACCASVWLVCRLRPWAERDSTRRLAWAVLAVILLHSMLEYPLWYGPFQLAALLCALVLWETRTGVERVAFPPSVSSHPITQPEPLAVRKWLGRAMLGSAICLAVAYVAWDYHRVSQIYLPPQARASAYREQTVVKVGNSWLFRNHVLFAELTTTKVTLRNAVHVHALATRLLHFSPEPRVIEPLITSAALLGQDDEAFYYLTRLRAAFPTEYARWTRPALPRRLPPP